MKKLILIALIVFCCGPNFGQAPEASNQLQTSGKRIIIAADVILNGKGQILRNTRIVIKDSKIIAMTHEQNR